jgi:calcineurin-like phosphoesterase family protein
MEPRTFITSDLHFFHKRIIEFCPNSRPFKDLDEMHFHLVQNWNSKISYQDNVYILGDVSFGSAYDTCRILDRLNGQKFHIIGNHDSKLIKSADFRQRFAWSKDLYTLKYNDKRFVLCHFPFLIWDQQHRGNYHLHGHLHSINPMKLTCRRFDVGLDGTTDFSPYLIDDLIKIIDDRLLEEPKTCHHNRGID